MHTDNEAWMYICFLLRLLQLKPTIWWAILYPCSLHYGIYAIAECIYAIAECIYATAECIYVTVIEKSCSWMNRRLSIRCF
jgi:hypothetical protein